MQLRHLKVKISLTFSVSFGVVKAQFLIKKFLIKKFNVLNLKVLKTVMVYQTVLLKQ